MEKEKIIEVMDTYPEIVANAKEKWQVACLEHKKILSETYMKIKAENAHLGLSETHLKHMAQMSDEVYKAELDKIVLESDYNRLHEELLCAKKFATFREAY